MSLDYRALSEREWELRDAAIKWSHGERVAFPEPSNPTAVEKHYLSAIAYFAAKRPTAAFDEFEKGDYRALLRYKRARKARR